ncbi:MAG TPA: 5-bromo-4-chloroindolyl phosphate hydrolysis family protein [Candidatus Limivicinus faecipullorum]|nr:5-bromo-4-chloroindolyl phosphate hydrolysis family protein [Candidatus Limivicinus faecipullorum]
MSKRSSKKRRDVLPYYSFAGVWLLCACILPLYRVWAMLLTVALSGACAYFVSRRAEKAGKEEAASKKPAESKKAAEEKKSYGPEIDPILEEGARALGEMARIYSSVQDKEVRRKINELMRITDKITQDAIADPSDIPQIKKFMNYYLPTTIKLLNAYDRMSAQGIEGENLDRSMNNINEMLDQAIVAYKKRLDSLFENQALDIETDIEVMNRMLAREGLTGEKDFDL